MVKNMNKEKGLNSFMGFKVTYEQKVLAATKGIRAEHFRQFIESFGSGEKESRIKSGDWRRLKDILVKVPSLQLVGAVGAGKSHLVRELVQNDRDHVYIVLDSHNGYSSLPKIHQISPDVKVSSVLELPKNDEAAGLNFKLYKTLIQHDTYPKHFILVVDEALRYKNYGIKNLLAESRKFLKVLAVSQEKLVDFVPAVYVENYNKVNI